MSDQTPETPATEEDTGVSVEILDEGPCRKRMKVVVTSEKVSEELETNYRQLRTTITLPGFRKGKVPVSVIKGKFGSKIEQEVKDEMLSSTFFDEIEKRELRVLGQPSFENIEFAPGDPFSYEAAIEIAPEFEIPEYKGLEIDAQPVSVHKNEVDEEIQGLLAQSTTLEPIADGEQKDDDWAVCHVEILDGEGTSQFAKDEVHLKIGLDKVDNIDVPDLGKKLIAAKAEETLEFTIDIPEDFPVEAVKGQSSTLQVRFLEAKRPVVPELNEEMLGQLGVESEDALREEIEKSLTDRRRIEEETRQEEDLVSRVLETVDCEFPPSILERRKEEVAMGRRFRMMRDGRSKEEAEADVTASEKEIDAEARDELKRIFVLDAIAEKESVLVTEDEIARRITAIAMTSGKDPQKLAEEYREGGMIDELRGGLRREKVRQTIRKKAKVNQPAGAEETDSSDSEGSKEE